MSCLHCLAEERFHRNTGFNKTVRIIMGVVVTHALILMPNNSPKLNIIQDAVLSDVSIEGMPEGMESESKSGLVFFLFKTMQDCMQVVPDCML